VDGTACGDADNGAGSDRRNSERCSGNITERASVDTQRQEGQGVPRGVPAIGRENLWRVNPRSAAGTK
jgi:hypothetical protein